jgi:hypothetical protein
MSAAKIGRTSGLEVAFPGIPNAEPVRDIHRTPPETKGGELDATCRGQQKNYYILHVYGYAHVDKPSRLAVEREENVGQR